MSHYGGGSEDAPPGYSGPPRNTNPPPGYQSYNYNQPPQQYYPATAVNAQPYNPRHTQHAQADLIHTNARQLA